MHRSTGRGLDRIMCIAKGTYGPIESLVLHKVELQIRTSD